MKQPRFPITLWPQQPLPEPLISRSQDVQIAEHPVVDDRTGRETGYSEWIVEYRGLIEEAPLPPELFLRGLLAVDPQSGESVVHFVSAHGVIGRRFHGPATSVELPTAPLTDVARYLATAQALSRQWLAVVEDTGEDLLALWTDIEGTDGQLDPLADPWLIFTRHLTRGLAVIHPWVDSIDRPDLWTQLPPPLRPPRFGLYGGLCIQVFNALVADETARRCQNETCGRAFVRQQGGAEYGQHRTVGVLYCTPECARAQAQREYRRRKRAERDRSQP